jgi:hypothetical protein
MNAAEPMYAGVVITNDVLKVDNRLEKKYQNPQEIHSDWLFALLGETLAETLRCPVSTLNGTEPNALLNRFRFYTDFRLPFDTTGWASIYCSKGKEADYITEALQPYKNHLFIGFELSPLLIHALDKAGIDYIDLTVHSLRFLPDYVFGLRSNKAEFQSRITAMTIPYEDIKSHARVSLGRSARVYRNRHIDPGSAVFLGQIDLDSSLIDKGRMISTDDILSTLGELKAFYPKVYYKFHPHRKDRKEFEEIITKDLNIDVIDVNLYDLFVDRNIGIFCGISSGSLIEAEIFGHATLRFSTTPSSHAVRPEDVKPELLASTYLPVSGISLTPAFWRHLLLGAEESLDPRVPLPTDALKFMLNQKWAR